MRSTAESTRGAGAKALRGTRATTPGAVAGPEILDEIATAHRCGRDDALPGVT